MFKDELSSGNLANDPQSLNTDPDWDVPTHVPNVARWCRRAQRHHRPGFRTVRYEANRKRKWSLRHRRRRPPRAPPGKPCVAIHEFYFGKSPSVALPQHRIASQVRQHDDVGERNVRQCPGRMEQREISLHSLQCGLPGAVRQRPVVRRACSPAHGRACTKSFDRQRAVRFEWQHAK